MHTKKYVVGYNYGTYLGYATIGSDGGAIWINPKIEDATRFDTMLQAANALTSRASVQNSLQKNDALMAKYFIAEVGPEVRPKLVMLGKLGGE